MSVLAYSQFGDTSEAVYLTYLKVFALSLLGNGTLGRGALAAAADRVVGCELGPAFVREMAGVVESLSPGGDATDGLASYELGGVRGSSESVVTRGAGLGCGWQSVSGMVDVGGGRDVGRVDGVEPVECVGAGSNQCDNAAVKSGETVKKDRGRWYESNKRKKLKKQAVRSTVPEWRRGARPLVDGSGGCVSDESVTGSVRTVDTRTGVEIAAAQTLAARRVAENERAEAEAKVAKKLAEHRLVALQDKDRTVAVQRLAAARYEQKINEAKAKSQASYKKCDESMKSLGSTGSAGEFALKQMVKEARDNAKTLKYVQEQADLFYQYATPEVRRMVAEMPEPEMEDEFDVFGDCPSDYDEEQREAYYDDLNRRNANHGLVGSSPAPPRRELTPEEFLKIEEEIRALSANQV